MMSFLTGYFTGGPSWAYFTYEPSSGLLHRGPSWAYFTYEPSSGLLHRGLLGLTSLTSLLAGYFQGPSWAYFTYEPSSGLLQRGPSWAYSWAYFRGGLLGLLNSSLFSHLASTMASE